MEVIKLDPRLRKKAAEVVTASFFEYPMFTFYFPDPKKRTQNMAWYLGNVLTCALRYGEVFTTPDLAGVAFTLPPGHTKISQWEYLLNGFMLTPLKLGPHDFVRSQDCEAFVATTHEEIMCERPHYYLWGLAIEPAHKRQGVGTALMQPLLRKADAEKMPFYLETHDENNVKYYQRMGFELARADKIRKYGLPIWCMLREPQVN
jgi:ribosomal protein S18 acetylase RimI-like enzyme